MDTRLRQNGWWQRYANDPLSPAVARDVVSDVEAYLEEVGLRFAMPDDFVAVDMLIRTADGELDQTHFPRRETSLRESSGGVEPVGPVEEALATLWRDVLNVDRVGRHDSFFDLGGDSMRGIQIVGQAKRLGLDLALRDLIEHQTIAGLAAAAERPARTQVAADEVREPETVHGAVPLGFAHRRIIESADDDYFIGLMHVQHFACHRLLRVEPLRRAIEHLFNHHDALRIELRRTPAGIELWNAESTRATADLLWEIDLSDVQDADQAAEIGRISAKLKDVTDLGSVSMVRFALIDLGADQPQMLLVAAHHAIWDAVTSVIFLDDLRTCYDRAARGRELRLPPKTSSMKSWAERLEAEGPLSVAGEIGYWRERLSDEAVMLPLDGAPVAEDVFSGYHIDVAMTVHETRAIRTLVQSKCDATLEEILLAAIGIAVTRWTGKRKAVITMLGHGRDRLLDGLDVSRTIGWFTSDYPLILNVSDVGNAVDAVKIVKDEVRHVPHNGIGYSILRYLGDAKPLAGYAHPRILLNHLGAGTHPTTGPLRFVGFDNTIPAMRHVNSPKASIQITSRVYHDALEVFWMCNETVFKKSTVATVAEGMASVLRQLIAECENDARS